MRHQHKQVLENTRGRKAALQKRNRHLNHIRRILSEPSLNQLIFGRPFNVYPDIHDQETDVPSSWPTSHSNISDDLVKEIQALRSAQSDLEDIDSSEDFSDIPNVEQILEERTALARPITPISRSPSSRDDYVTISEGRETTSDTSLSKDETPDTPVSQRLSASEPSVITLSNLSRIRSSISRALRHPNYSSRRDSEPYPPSEYHGRATQHDGRMHGRTAGPTAYASVRRKEHVSEDIFARCREWIVHLP